MSECQITFCARQPLSAWIQGVGLIAPGLPDWPSAVEVLNGSVPYTCSPSVLPVPAILPSAERRRASRVVKLALALGLEAAQHGQVDVSTLATVFTASGADGHNCDALCEQLATDDRQISPTRFHNSVHNAAAGYWGIATRSMAPCQVLCAYDASFGAGLLDAMAQVVHDQVPVLLIAYDSEYPEPLFSKRPVPDCAGVALLLTPERTLNSLACLRIQPSSETAQVMSHDALEALRQQVPAMRALPLLQSLACHQTSTIFLDYLAPMQLSLELNPC
jgi:hypothetical protein